MIPLYKLNYKNFCKETIKIFGIVEHLFEEMTIGEFTSYLISTKCFNRQMMANSEKNFYLYILKNLSNKPSLELHNEDLIKVFEDYKALKKDYDENKMNRYKTTFRKNIIGKAINYKVITKHYSRQWTNLVVELIDRGYYKSYEKDIIAHSFFECVDKVTITISRAIAFKKLFKDIYLKKWNELTENNLNNIKNVCKSVRSASSIFQDVLDVAISNNIEINDDLFYLTRQKSKLELQNLNSDLWYIVEKKTKSALVFEDYLFDNDLKDLIKKWMQWRIESRYKDHKSVYTGIKKILISFLEEEKIPLKKLNRLTIQKWLSWIKRKSENGVKGYSENSCLTRMKYAKQFIKYVLDYHEGILGRSANKILDIKLFKQSNSKGKSYSDYEIKIMLESIKKDKGSVVSDILILAMLMARRTEEILSIKTNCIVEIGEYKYVKYTNFKTNKEDKFPLYSLRKNASLFEKSSEEIILDILSKWIKKNQKISRLSHPDECDFVFLLECERRNVNGFIVTALRQSNFNRLLNIFKEKYGIKFRIVVHEFRHTLASKGLRKGMNEAEIARLLGNEKSTVTRYYEADLTKEETLALDGLPMLNVIEDAKKLAEMNSIPEVLTCDTEYTVVVPGGLCKKGEEAKKNCRFYNRLFGSGGCLGCAQLAVVTKHEDYYSNLKEKVSEEYKTYIGTPFEKSSRSKLELIENTLYRIRNVGNKVDEW
ncbi:hypothetical protein CRV03_03550 [Arcobacter sp. F155]|uniref:tyrosine-type recombinase/integrase n=1 Tax=Arcobacter sp. F155 TaxID=2044512 RepID=UPI00100C1D78|nr:site-specific integrase [Arcobacter sp. F155]RXJ78057.1 hypothetical protein CRV03_03550 [Arcobacter sp. F155]